MIGHVEGECIEWAGCLSGDGYGTVTIGGIQKAAHRVAWEKHNMQIIPKGMWVLHKCDNPKCVNPEHLYVGTAKQNTADCIVRGRRNTPQGSGRPNSKLTESDVAEIRGRCGSERVGVLADRYHVSDATISMILSGKTWKHVMGVPA